MVYIPRKTGGKESLLAEVRATVEGAGGRVISLQEFLLVSGMKPGEVSKHFAGWDDVLQAAGFEPCDKGMDAKRLLADWGRVARKLRRVPSRKEYERHGRHGATELARRFGSWNTMREAFRAFAGGRARWKDVIALFPAADLGDKAEARGEARRTVARGRPAGRLAGRPVCGEALDCGALRRSPMNEQGVIFLFALLAEQLGFEVETLQAGFPDCEAKRRIRPRVWQTVRIEFEYESRNFRDHGHPVDGCDIIVCWIHNWPDCPANLEVIALSEEVERLGESGK